MHNTHCLAFLDGLDQHDHNTNITDGGADGNNQIPTEEADGNNQITNTGDQCYNLLVLLQIASLVLLLNRTGLIFCSFSNCNLNVHLHPGGNKRGDRGDRGLNKGRGLHKLTRCRGKLPVVITEGNIRPVVPLIAAKFATECNIAVRRHLPILTHWKEYKKQDALFEIFLGALRVSAVCLIQPNNISRVLESASTLFL